MEKIAIYFLKIENFVTCDSCFHLAVVFKSVVAKILLQRWRQMIIPRQPFSFAYYS